MRRIIILISALALFVLSASPVFAGDSAEISAKALDDHTCNSSEWHFVITQVDSESNAPASIDVTFSGGDTVSVPLDDKFTGGTAHYTEVSHLNETVVSATTSIYSGWSGQFNLSHGPCGDTPPPTNGNLTCPGEFSLPISTVVRSAEGSQTLLATVDVDPSAVGETASITAVAENQSSVHPGNDLVVASGGTEVVLEDVERAPGVETVADGTLTLGTTVTVTLVMGPDEVFSAGITITIVCEDAPPPEFDVIPPGPECEPWQPSWTLVVPDFEGTLYAFFDEGFARELVSGQDEVVTTQEPIEGDSSFGVSVEDTGGNVVFTYSDSVSPLSDEECEEEETTTTTAPKVEDDTSTTAPPTTQPSTDTSTTAAPAPDGDAGKSVPWAIPVGAAVAVAALMGLAWRSRTE